MPLIILFYVLFSLQCQAENLEAKTYEFLGLANVKKVMHKKFKGQTSFEKTHWQQKECLMAQSFNSASGLVFEGPWEITQTSEIYWEWLGEKFPQVNLEKEKKGDDFIGRVYLVFKTGPFPWQVQSLNYVWSQQAEPEESWKNPFTDKATMVNVMKKNEHTGKWFQVRRNILSDAKKYLGSEFGQIDAIAFMSDSDNGEGQTQLCLSALSLY
jgi:hypothetical protein